MRPRKEIVLIQSDVVRLSVRRFLLENKGYRVTGGTCPRRALEYLETVPDGQVFLVIADFEMPEMTGEKLAEKVKQIFPLMPVLLVSDVISDLRETKHADVFLHRAVLTSADLVDRVRCMCSRKRGPKRIVRAVVVASTAIEERMTA